MKTSCLQLTAALAVLVGAGSLLSGQSVSLRADIPFEFAVGKATIPAGECTLRSTNTPGMIQVHSVAGGQTAMFIAIVGNAPRADAASALVFNRYGDDYYLASVMNGDMGTQFHVQPSRIEKELSRSARVRTQLRILAQR